MGIQQKVGGGMSSMSISPRLLCALSGCGKEGLYQCACQMLRYCGEQHQRDHWVTIHMNECRARIGNKK